MRRKNHGVSFPSCVGAQESGFDLRRKEMPRGKMEGELWDNGGETSPQISQAPSPHRELQKAPMRQARRRPLFSCCRRTHRGSPLLSDYTEVSRSIGGSRAVFPSLSHRVRTLMEKKEHVLACRCLL